MATPIRSIPVLEGEDAEEFVRNAEVNAKKPTPRLSHEAKQKLEDFLARSRAFKFE